MFVELVYDKRNFDGLPGAKDIILGELSKGIHRIFPDADVRHYRRSILNPVSMRRGKVSFYSLHRLNI